MRLSFALVRHLCVLAVFLLAWPELTSARFVSVDPKADQYPALSPYIYSANNPIKFVDPDGNAFTLLSTVARETGKPSTMSPLWEAIVYDIPGPSVIAGSVMKPASAGLKGLLGATFRRLLGKTDDAADAAKSVAKVADEVVETASEGRKIPSDELLSPPSKRGNAPTGSDGKPVELHHRGQDANGPLDEMTRTQHRGQGNFEKNHPNTGQNTSKIDRTRWIQQKRDYWKREWDSGRFKDIE